MKKIKIDTLRNMRGSCLILNIQRKKYIYNEKRFSLPAPCREIAQLKDLNLGRSRQNGVIVLRESYDVQVTRDCSWEIDEESLIDLRRKTDFDPRDVHKTNHFQR